MKTEILLSNYEEYLLLALDGELDAATESALLAFLDAHPELADEVAAFEAVKIPVPENAPVFEGKEMLLKPIMAPSKFRKFRPFIWSAAALLLLWIGIRARQNFPEKAPQVAGISNASQPARPRQTPPVSGNHQAPQTMPDISPQTAPQLAHNPTSKAATFPEIGHTKKPRTQPAISGNTPLVAAPDAPENMDNLPITAGALIPENLPAPEAPAPLVIVYTAAPAPTGLEINIPTLDALRETVSEKALALREAHRNLKNTEATFIVGNRELFTIRF